MERFPASRISLLDLSSQMPFEMDDAIKEQICFGETLLVSCAHYDGDIRDNESSDSEWSCQDTESESSEEVKDDKMFEVKDRVEEEQVVEKPAEEEDDFHFYFFPDCEKPSPSQYSDASLIVVEGLPQINPNATKFRPFCICEKTKGDECVCVTKLPCKCGAKEQAECKCAQLETICVCKGGDPAVKCTCHKNKEVCVCYPGQIRTKCTCDEVEKPCICRPGKSPYPVCTCKFKPKLEDLKSIGEENEDIMEENEHAVEEKVLEEEIGEPCKCQEPEPKPHCLCLKGKDCVCNDQSCICGVQKTCVCEPTDSQDIICKSNDSKTICSCDKPPVECTCAGEGIDCKCFPKKICTCGNPDDCKCFAVCECADPCICDTAQKDQLECICLDKSKKAETGLVCTCPCIKEQTNKLKRVKAGKHGYRWCHDVDPRHTFFDYGYDRHDKISYKEKEREKVQILGLNAEKEEEGACAAHGVKVPPFKKKVRKPSIDCCSSVGGISISVECLGEDKDKFLVQVVSHASKEGAKTGSKLVSILDCNLHTMEENRSEHITKKDLTKERRSYIAICENGYYNKVTRICGERNVVKRHYHTFDDSKNFLLEGACVVLMRFFALKRFRGTVRTETVMMDGTICESIYVSKGVTQGIVNGKPLFVVKVERHILEPSGYVHQTLTVLSLRGYIVSHEWADNCYIMHINPLLDVISTRDIIEPHEPLRERWREDLQLLSDYLDFKSARTSEGGRYMTECGALTATVRDYLQALLLLRPHDALHFTQHYLSSALSALDLPHDEYFDPSSKHVRYFFFEE